MAPESNDALDHNDLFVDSSHRVAAVSAARTFQTSGWLPATIHPDPASVTKIEPGNGFLWYVVHYQTQDFGPIVRVGVETSGIVQTRKLANMQASLYAGDGSTIMLALDRSTIMHGGPGETLTFLVQSYAPNGNRQTQFQYLHNLTTDTKTLSHETMTPFGLITDASAQVKKAPIPDIDGWPDKTISLAALRLLDEERAKKLFAIWPDALHANWGDMTMQETMDELSQRVISSY